MRTVDGRLLVPTIDRHVGSSPTSYSMRPAGGCRTTRSAIGAARPARSIGSASMTIAHGRLDGEADAKLRTHSKPATRTARFAWRGIGSGPKHRRDHRPRTGRRVRDPTRCRPPSRLVSARSPAAWTDDRPPAFGLTRSPAIVRRSCPGVACRTNASSRRSRFVTWRDRTPRPSNPRSRRSSS